MRILIPRLALLFALCVLCAAASSADLEAELNRLDAFAADPDGKLILTAAIGEQLGMHRNRIILLRKETGKSYSSIVMERLRGSAADDTEVLRKVRHINEDVERRFAGGRAASLAPVAYLTATWDYSTVGSIYTVLPEVGVESRRLALVASVPLHRLTGIQQSAAGVGDLQLSATLRHAGERFGAWGSVSLGLPTGDSERGLGAGKATADGSGTLSWRFDRARVFGTAGLTNSVFRNVGYQRPYITTGTAAYGAAGVEGTLHRRIGAGAGGFFLEPQGDQTVINRMGGTLGHTPETGISGMGGMHRPQDMPAMQVPTGTQVSASELSDRGPNAWAWFVISDAVNLNFTIARSVPLELTTVRVGFGLDVYRLLRR